MPVAPFKERLEGNPLQIPYANRREHYFIYSIKTDKDSLKRGSLRLAEGNSIPLQWMDYLFYPRSSYVPLNKKYTNRNWYGSQQGYAWGILAKKECVGALLARFSGTIGKR